MRAGRVLLGAAVCGGAPVSEGSIEGSIKGAAVEPIVNLTHELLGSGQLSRHQLEARLESSDLELLEVKPEPTLWYPIASAERIELFVAEIRGRSSGLVRTPG
jgi:hypothetical protein